MKKIFFLLQRVTSSGNKILYIDGLRFFAVVSVFLFHFVDCYNDQNIIFKEKYDYVYNNLVGSVIGVFLFFAISGFIIAMPFYNNYVNKVPGFSYKNYYFRRVTRLEPPYIIHLLLLFFLMVFVLKTKTFSETFPRLLASIFYSHEIIYNQKPIINTVLWTLEIEIQFYIIAPLLAFVFKLKNTYRRLILIGLIVLFRYSGLSFFSFPTIFNYFHFFIIGFLALDVYMQIKDKIMPSLIYDIICLMALLFLWFSVMNSFLVIFIFILLTFSSKTLYFIKMLENKFIYTIGGMCYTIYMLHQKIIYLVINLIFPKNLIGDAFLVDFFVRLLYVSLAILVISSIFFIFVERPTMKKNWWKYRSLKKLFFE